MILTWRITARRLAVRSPSAHSGTAGHTSRLLFSRGPAVRHAQARDPSIPSLPCRWSPMKAWGTRTHLLEQTTATPLSQYPRHCAGVGRVILHYFGAGRSLFAPGRRGSNLGRCRAVALSTLAVVYPHPFPKRFQVPQIMLKGCRLTCLRACRVAA